MVNYDISAQSMSRNMVNQIMPAVSKLASYPIGIYYVRWHFTCSVVIPISIVPHVVGRERGGDLGKLLWPEAKTHPTM